MQTLQRLKLRDIRRDQIFIEEDFGFVAKFRALEDAHEVDMEHRKGHECRARVVEGSAGTADDDGVVTFFECHKPGAYGLKLFPA